MSLDSHKLNLRDYPAIYVLSAHLSDVERQEVENVALAADATLTRNANEARIFLANITHKRRVSLELRALRVWNKEVEASQRTVAEKERPSKRVKLSPDEGDGADSDSSRTLSASEIDDRHVNSVPQLGETQNREVEWIRAGKTIKVVSVAWLRESSQAKKVLPFEKFLLYECERVTADGSAPAQAGKDILERAVAELESSPTTPSKRRASPFHSPGSRHHHARQSGNRVANLVHHTTSEDEIAENLPEMPDWIKRGSTFSCERATLMRGPNDEFVQQLKKIRLARILTSDEIGVRAYSTSIAAVAAYPHQLTSPHEILALPGCETKIAALWVEFKESGGVIQSVVDAENDEKLKALRLFYNIWGVGAHGARRFYNQGWRDLDDIVEYGWDQLTRVQQIGVKYYDEFSQTIPRKEVEFIADMVKEHAQRVREPNGVRTCIVGGYRRGKLESGDVDIILTHTDEKQTLNILEDVVGSLVKDGWITHELITHTSGTRREQATLPYNQIGGGHGFDSLDKALVVWQDPHWSGQEQAQEGGEEEDKKKNPNLHRRVDIIIGAWSKIGCAVLGWSADTTFERDLRRYARKVKGWKFDSSGVRDRRTGQEVDLQGECTSIEEAEKNVFRGFGLEYREPWERCTG